MSLKPIKKSDQFSSWNKKSSVSPYITNRKKVSRKYLIVCEGQTEKIYFGSFPITNITVTTKGVGRTKLALVKKAKELAKEDNYDEIWCVFDMDINYADQENQRNDFNSAIKQCQETKKFNVAYSNDCFELWFYLHFDYTDQQNHRSFYYKKLREFWSINYEEKGKELEYNNAFEGNGVFLVVINGTVKLGDIELGKRDAIGISDSDSFTITASENAEILAIEVPM